ncbi:response regulator [Pedobacter petrophilus]|uniref:Response regulator n=1 Tax=Pedobacter petrophilus TaxID=1908241 RepID=A0A7K0G4W1_9SPHI|nr:response regulator [Pedobacter petrophilus]MRX78500.1 response regulator [Pedobacter petrophilus]
MNKKILFLDDDPIALYSFGAILKDAGYEVRCVESTELFSSQVDEFLPNLIILDIRLGNTDGRKICNELKLNMATRNIPIVMLTALSHEEISEMECEADAIIGKSLESANLLLTVGVLLKNQVFSEYI